MPRPTTTSVEPIGGFHNPEDVEVVASQGLLLVSNNAEDGGGSLAGLSLPLQSGQTPDRLWPTMQCDDYDTSGDLVGDKACRDELPPECLPVLAANFSPHGVSTVARSEGTVRVAVVDHRPCDPIPPACAKAFDGRDAIELFDFRSSDGKPRLVWRGCVRMEEGTRGNDLGLAPDGETIVVANCAPHRMWSWLAGLFWRVGDLRQWSKDSGWITLAGSSSHNPNGVIVTNDAVYFSASTSGEVVRLPRNGTKGASDARSICVGGYPDNLTLTPPPRSTLLVATHTSLGRFLKCAKSGCASPWAVYELSLDLTQSRLIIANDGNEVPLVSSAALLPAGPNEQKDRFVFGSVAGTQLGVLSPPKASGLDSSETPREKGSQRE